MKKRLLSSVFMVMLLFTAMTVSSQEVYFLEGFAANATPDGWETKDVSYSNGSQAPNQLNTEEEYSAKMKTNNTDSWIQFPKVNGVTFLSFWCKLRDPDNNPIVKIQSSPDGETWTDVVVNPEQLDLENTEDFQDVTVLLNISGEVIIRLYVIADGGTTSKGMLYVDDIQLGKPSVASNDASLLSLSVDGSMIDGFDFNVRSYTQEISHAMGYMVSAEANHPDATVEITQVANIDGTEEERTATVVVTSKDESVTTTTTIVFTQTDYWYKEGFANKTGLNGWERFQVFQSSNIKLAGNEERYVGNEAIRFLGGHPTGSQTEPGYLLSPKMINVGTLTFSTGVEGVFGDQNLKVYIMKGSDSTMVKELDWIDLEVAWQEVEVEINEFSDSIQIKIVGICDINDEATSRIWMDNFLVTYMDGGVGAQLSDSKVSDINIYPNPVEKTLNVKMDNQLYNRISICNLSGQNVLESNISSAQTELDVRNLSQGIYLISVSGELGTQTFKFVKK